MVSSWLSYFVILLVTLSLLLYKYLNRNYNYWKNKNVPYVKPYPIFGNMFGIMALKTTIGERLWEWYDSFGNSDCFGIFVFDQPILVLKSSKLVKAILQKDFSNFEDRTVVTDYSDPVMDSLLFFKTSPTWRPIRAKISPVFTSGKLKQMFQSILLESNEMVDYISKFANVPNMEAKEISAKYSTNVITRCSFGVDGESFKDENAEFRNITRQMFGYKFTTAMRQFGSFYAPNIIKTFRIPFFPPSIVSACKRIFADILKSRKDSPNVKNNDLIEMLMETNRKSGEEYFTHDNMVGHALTFFAAGFETVSSTLSFALYELAINPKWQNKLREEIRESTEKEGLTYSAIHDMKYLDMVVSETLRMYPVVPFIDRKCKDDYKVEGSDLVIDKGTAIYIPVFGFNYDPQYFPEPKKFDPERFSDKSKINNDGIFYVPFGGGPRICIGQRFGLMGVKTGLAQILLKFNVEISDKTPFPIVFEPKSIVLQSKVGIPLKFVPL